MYYPARACQDLLSYNYMAIYQSVSDIKRETDSVLLWGHTVNSQVFLSKGLD